MAEATDPEIFARATDEARVIVSAATDFGTLLPQRQQSKPSVLPFRRGTDRKPEEQIRLLLANLPTIAEALERGSVVVFGNERIRVRSLPIIPV